MKRKKKLLKTSASIFTLLLAASQIAAPAYCAEASATGQTQEASEATSDQEALSLLDSQQTIPTVQFLKITGDWEGNSAVLVNSPQGNVLIISGMMQDGLADQLASNGIRKVNHLILAGAEGQEDALSEVLSVCNVENLYTAGNEEAIAIAQENEITVENSDYFQVGDINVILYADDNKTLGSLVYTPQCAVFIADSLTDMSVLRSHGELGYLTLLSITANTGLDPEVIQQMNPGSCVVSGDFPDAQAMQAFQNTDVMEDGNFYFQGNAAFGISLKMDYQHEIEGAVAKPIESVQKTETPGSQEPMGISGSTSTSYSFLGDGGYVHSHSESEGINGNLGIEIGAQTQEEDSLEQDPSSEKPEETISDSPVLKSNEEIAIEINSGLWGKGQERFDRLRAEGYDPDAIQAIVDDFAAHPEKRQEAIDALESEKQKKETAVPDSTNVQTESATMQEQETEGTNIEISADKEPETAKVPVRTQYVTATVYAPENSGGETKVQETELGSLFTPEPDWILEEGYVLEGWYTDPEFTRSYDNTVPVTANLSLYPKVRAARYVIAFEANEGEGTMDSISCDYGLEYMLPENAFTKKGCSFSGWNTGDEGTNGGRALSQNASVKNLTSKDGDIVTLYAQWDTLHTVAIGDGQTVKNGGEAEFFVDGNINEFMSAVIDTKLLPASSMEIEGDENQIHIILTQDIVRNTGEGLHDIIFNFTDGSCRSSMVVDRQVDEKVAVPASVKSDEQPVSSLGLQVTLDHNTIIYIICGAAAVLAFILGFLIRARIRKKRTDSEETRKIIR